MKALLNSFHLKSCTLGLQGLTENVEPPCTAQQTVPNSVKNPQLTQNV